MKHRLLLLTLLSAALLTGCGESESRKLADADARPDAVFGRYKDRFLDSLWYYNPEWASGVGYHRYDSLLLPPTAARRQTEAAAVARRLREMQAYQLDSLSVPNQIDYQLMQNYLHGAQWYQDTLRAWQWNPAEYNLSGAVAEILNGRYQPLDRRLRAISFKISRAVDYYAAAEANISRPTREHTELAIAQNEGGRDVFGKALEDSVARSGLSAREKAEFATRLSTAKLAIDRYVDFLRQDVLPKGNFRGFRLGPALFDRKFHYDIQSAYSADQVYQKALAHKQELRRDMHARAARLWPTYYPGQPAPTDSTALIQQVINKLASKHTTRQGFVAAVKAQIPTLTKFVDEHKLLTQDPKQPLVVRETPKYMRGGGAGASVSAPGPYEKGADTYYNVTPLDGLTDAQAESYLREYNDYTLQILNIHEGVPGHYTQLVYANRSPSRIKSVLGNGAMIEGWAVYSERMMLESGYAGGSDEIWLLWDKWNMRVTLNAILDHDVQAGHITEAQTVALLRRDGFQEETEARNKWRRATLSQVQLSSYFAGYSAIYDLRQELKQQEGKSFSLKAFNEQFLSYGSAPVKYIRRLMLKQQ